MECPKSKDRFDDPVEFRLKWRDWFASQKRDAELLIDTSEERQRVSQEFDAHIYPEDLKYREDAVAFFKEQQQYDPELFPEVDNEDTDTLVEPKTAPPPKERIYRDLPAPEVLSVADSAKFSGKL